jgi:hypothetical protein
LSSDVDTKEVAFGIVDQYTKDKPSIRGALNYAFVNNVIAAAICYPLSFMIYSCKPMRALKSSLLLCVFSMANDLFIEFRRKKFIELNFSQ